MVITEKLERKSNGGLGFYFKNYTKNNLKPGEYLSTVEDISLHPGYEDGSAFLIKYKLKPINSENESCMYDHKETFLLDYANTRTKKLINYLEDHDITPDNILEFVGCVEKVTIDSVMVREKVYLNITGREFVSHRKDGDTK